MVNSLITFFINFLTHLLVTASVYSIVYLVWVIYQQHRAAQRQSYRHKPPAVSTTYERTTYTQPQPIAHTRTPSPPRQQVFNPYLESRLISLLNGDVRTAQRLLNNVRDSNPGRSPDWCMEKVIYDLERDRH